MTTPAREWRETVRRDMPRVRDDDALREVAERDYPASAGLERFILAVALLTFGRADAAGAILDELPPVRHPARILARALDALLPTGGNTPADPDATRAWLAVHADELEWNEIEGRYRLR